VSLEIDTPQLAEKGSCDMAKIWFGKWKKNQPICLPFYKLFILCHKASQFHEKVKLKIAVFQIVSIMDSFSPASIPNL
jgi:hypothetical protein